MQVAEKAFLVGLGAFSIARERVQKKIDELVQKGEGTKSNTGNLLRELIQKGRAEKEALRSTASRSKGAVLDQLKFATKEDIARLEQKLEELKQKLT